MRLGGFFSMLVIKIEGAALEPCSLKDCVKRRVIPKTVLGGGILMPVKVRGC